MAHKCTDGKKARSETAIIMAVHVYYYRVVISANQIHLIHAKNHVADAQTGQVGGAVLLNVGNEHTSAQFGVLAFDDHDSQAVCALQACKGVAVGNKNNEKVKFMRLGNEAIDHTFRTVTVRTPLNFEYLSSSNSFSKWTGNCVNGLTAISSKAPSLLKDEKRYKANMRKKAKSSDDRQARKKGYKKSSVKSCRKHT